MIKQSYHTAKLSFKLPLRGLGGFPFRGLVGFGCLILLTFFSCAKSPKGDGANADTTDTEEVDNLKKLYVATVPTIDCLPFFVACDNHLADSLGYRIILQEHTALNDCDTAYQHGSVCATPSDYMRAQRLADNNTVVFDNPNVFLSLFLNQRVRLKEAKQLTDKMIACDRKGVSSVLAQHVLDSVKLVNDKAFLVNFPDIQVRSKMLENNEMDALVLPEPYATVARKAGNPSVYTTSQYAGKQIGRIVARNKTSDIIRQIYNRACDDINAKGIHAYDEIIMNHTNVPKAILPSLPNRKFKKI